MIRFYTDNYFQGRHFVCLERAGDKLLLSYETEDGDWKATIIETLGM